MKVQDKAVVVTGAGSGMGRELTAELLRRGARVAGVDLRADSLEETAQLVPAADRMKPFSSDWGPAPRTALAAGGDLVFDGAASQREG